MPAALETCQLPGLWAAAAHSSAATPCCLLPAGLVCHLTGRPSLPEPFPEPVRRSHLARLPSTACRHPMPSRALCRRLPAAKQPVATSCLPASLPPSQLLHQAWHHACADRPALGAASLDIGAMRWGMRPRPGAGRPRARDLLTACNLLCQLAACAVWEDSLPPCLKAQASAPSPAPTPQQARSLPAWLTGWVHTARCCWPAICL